MTFVIIILVIVLLAALGTPNKGTQRVRNRNDGKSKTIYPPTPAVAELVKNVNTIEDFNEFERQQKQVYEKFSEDFDNKYYHRLYDIYESAYAKASDKICNKVFHYEYTPELGLKTSLKHLNLAYKLVDPDEYRQNKRGTDAYDWNEISGNELLTGKLSDYVKDRPTHLGLLIKYREIFESKLLFEEKVTAMISLIKQDDDFRNKYFNEIVDFDTQCRVLLLADMSIPSVELLIKNGYNTPYKIKRVTREQLKMIKGFGDKRIDKVLHSINNLR